MSLYENEISKRRTFAIISHPDAGKTTITEKVLLFGQAIQTAGTVKGRGSNQHAKSDWMEMEKQRGISITTSVMQFPYHDCLVNLLDTPGHEDFSEDTYRTLTAVDCCLMVIDAAKGVEDRTRKLMEVTRLRDTPILTFMNKLDRDIRDPMELLDEVENELKIGCAPITWPIGCGKLFKGVYHLYKDETYLYQSGKGHTIQEVRIVKGLNNPDLDAAVGEDLAQQLRDELELVKGASNEFDKELFLAGEITPVFFGTALGNFGVDHMLDGLVEWAPAPMPRQTDTRTVEASEDKFTGFVFKIQANMNKNHRDRIAFMRICSGQFTAGMEVYHVQGGKSLKLSQPQQMMADERKIVDKAYAGDIIGVFDPGVYSIGDTLTTAKDKFEFEGIPTFAPEHFARVSLVDSMKRKQFVKGVTQIAQEGAIQMFQEYKGGMEEIIVGVVGVLQFDVLKFRLENEYNVQIRLENLPYEHIRWIENKDEVNVDTINGTSDMKKVVDMKGNPLLLFINEWSIGMTLDRNDGLVLTEFGRN